MPSTFENMYGARYGAQMMERRGLPIYDSFPEFEVDNWSEQTRAKGRTKRKNVYLYDSRKQGNGGMYSDRMWQWDSAKMEAASKHLSRGWHSPASEISVMLDAYAGRKLELTQVIMMEDACGYELFYIAFYDKTQDKPTAAPSTPTPPFTS